MKRSVGMGARSQITGCVVPSLAAGSWHSQHGDERWQYGVLVSEVWICTRTRLRRLGALGRIEHEGRASASHVVNLEWVLRAGSASISRTNISVRALSISHFNTPFY